MTVIYTAVYKIVDVSRDDIATLEAEAWTFDANAGNFQSQCREQEHLSSRPRPGLEDYIIGYAYGV